MKKITLILFLLLPSMAFLQPSKDKEAPYFKTIGYPDIKLRLTDSTTIFYKNNLPKDKTVAIIFFSPDCEHCQAEATELMKKKDSLSGLLMVWNANMMDDFNNVKAFYYKYGFDKLSNIVLGKEVDYYLPLFYRIETTPYAAVYKNGRLFTEFRNTLSIENLIAIANNTYIVPTIVATPITTTVLKETKKEKRRRKKKNNNATL
jgi:thiol-disulfide isomerase/thioredoxin